MEPTQPPTCEGCPLYGVGTGFVLGCGDPKTARYAVMLEAPGRDEVSLQLKPNPNRAFLATDADCKRELAIRGRDYPAMAERWKQVGVPVVGQTGLVLQFWIWPKAGITRDQIYIDNTIRCFPPKGKKGHYPTGDVRKEAERHCRQYDRLDKFRPDTVIFGLHPASMLREITPLPLAVKDFEKLRDFTSAGRRCVMLLGGKATEAFMRYGSNVTRWRGHYAKLAADWIQTYKSAFEFVKKTRKKKVKTNEEDIFGVPSETLKRAKEKTTRPEVTLDQPCKGVKRYQGKRPPKCGCKACWDKFEAVNGV